MLLEEIRNLKETKNYDRIKLDEIERKMRDEIGAAEMWNTIAPAFELDEYIENLEYIAKENDL